MSSSAEATLPSRASSRLEVIVGAAILNFDITSGDCVERKLGSLGAIADDRLSALAVPEGSHHVPEDCTYFLTASADLQPLFGLSVFLNQRDPSAPRGAYMKALLVLIRKPYFSFLTPILRTALSRYLASKSTDDTILPTVVTRVNALGSAGAQRPDSLTIWEAGRATSERGSLPGDGASFAVDMPATYPPDQFGLEKDSGLLRLVQRFREDTMLIWWALLLQTRVLFCGQPAGAVGACCLAAPMLVAPLTGFSEILAPYVPLSYPAQVEDVKAGGRYICGVTNGIFGQKTKWYDCLASLATGKVSGALTDVQGMRVRLGPAERGFIKNVLQAVERDGRGEAWVREQFRAFTDSFLVEVSMGADHGRAVRHRMQAEIWRLTASACFCGYLATKGGSLGASGRRTERGAREYYGLLVAPGAAPSGLPMSERSKLLFNLHSTLSNLDDIDALVGRGAVQALSANTYLRSESSQVRKYAAGVLAILASTIRGQVAVLAHGLLPVFVSMLAEDTMPAVCAAAANCLHRTASLYVGAQALVAAGVMPRLTRLLLAPPTDELVLRTLLASTLLRVYRSLPSAPRLDGAEEAVVGLLGSLTAARDFSLILAELLDTWRVPLALGVTPRLAELVGELPKVEAHCKAIQVANDAAAAARATWSLSADLAAHRWLALPLALCGVVETLIANAKVALALSGDAEDAAGGAAAGYAVGASLRHASLHALAALVDTHAGLSCALSLGPSFLGGLVSCASEAPRGAHASSACRTLEVMAQHAEGARAIASSRATLDVLVARILTAADDDGDDGGDPRLGSALGAVYQILRTLKREGVAPPPELRRALLPLGALRTLGGAKQQVRTSTMPRASWAGGADRARDAVLESVLSVVADGA